MVEGRDSSAHEELEAPIELSAEEARGGEIILRGRARRIIFIAGLSAFVLFVLVFLFLGGRS
jgi:hypothetical protein